MTEFRTIDRRTGKFVGLGWSEPLALLLFEVAPWPIDLWPCCDYRRYAGVCGGHPGCGVLASQVNQFVDRLKVAREIASEDWFVVGDAVSEFSDLFEVAV